MQFDILTLFPDLIYNYTDESILGRAQKQGLINVRAHNFREFSNNKWGHVDDKPYGGGPGMILQVEPIYECLKAIRLQTSDFRLQTGQAKRPKSEDRSPKTRIIVMDPAGKKFDQRMAEKYSKLDRLILVCGRYEGFDARVYKLADERVSVGEYVLAGGELPALTIVEALSRLIPGVLGNEESLLNETFSSQKSVKSIKSVKSRLDGLSTHSLRSGHALDFRLAAEWPQYTRPENFMGMKVPKVLLSGDHKKIEEWRKKRSK